jgi:hypothetical protein
MKRKLSRTSEPRIKAGRRDEETESERTSRAISTYPKGRRNGGRHPGFPESVLLRGRAWEREPRPARKPSTTDSQKERRREAQRRTLQVFRGNGLATRGCSAGKRGGELTQCASPSLGSVGPVGFLWPASLAVRGLRLLQNPIGSSWMARLSGGGHHANAGDNQSPRGVWFPMRTRMMALEGVPVRRIWSAEVGRRQRPNQAASQRQEGKTVDGGLAHE